MTAGIQHDQPPARVRAPMRPDESLASVAVRFAAIYGPSPDAFVTELLGLQKGQMPSVALRETSARLLAHVNGIEDAQLSRAMVTPAEGEADGRVCFHGLMLDRDQIELGIMRVAPGVLARDRRQNADPYHRASWAIRCLPCDPETGEVLIDQCPLQDCGVFFWWRDIADVARCPGCDLKLDLITPRRLSSAERRQTRFFENLMSDRAVERLSARRTLPQAVQGWPEADIVDLIDWLGVLECRLGQGNARVGLQERLRGLKLLRDLPGSLQKVIRGHLAERRKVGRLGALLGDGEIRALVRAIRSDRAHDLVEGLAHEVLSRPFK